MLPQKKMEMPMPDMATEAAAAVRLRSPRRRFDLIVTLLCVIAAAGTSAYFEYRASKISLYLKDWVMLAGIPYEMSQEEALDYDFLGTLGGESRTDAKVGIPYMLAENNVMHWTKCLSPINDIILLRCNGNSQGRTTNVVAYAYTTVNVAKATTAFFRVSADDGVKIWLNHKEIYRNAQPGTFGKDTYDVPVSLVAGENTILFKVTQAGGGWGFSALLQS